MKEESDSYNRKATPYKMKMEQQDDDGDSDLSTDRRRRSSLKQLGLLSPQSPDTPFTPFAEKSKVFEKWMGSTEKLYRKGEHPSSSLRNGVKQRLFFDENHVTNRNKPIHRYRVKYRSEGTFGSTMERIDHVEAIRMDFAVKKFHANRPNAKIISCSQLDH